MTGLDTSVVLRYIMQDDLKQSRKATELIESLTPNAPGFIAMVSLIEIFWVLTSSYKLTKDQVTRAIEQLLKTKELVLDRAEQVAQALRLYKTSSSDFADCLISRLCASAGCTETITFDISAAKIAGMKLIN